MTDFEIKSTVWLHGRTFKRGQEDLLDEYGFTEAQKIEQASRGSIVRCDSDDEEEEVKPLGTFLPDDFPHRADLMKQGVGQIDTVLERLEDGTLKDVYGIGEAKMEDIAAYFAEDE